MSSTYSVTWTTDFGAKLLAFAEANSISANEATELISKAVERPATGLKVADAIPALRVKPIKSRKQNFYLVYLLDEGERIVLLQDIQQLDLDDEERYFKDDKKAKSVLDIVLKILQVVITLLKLMN